MAWYKLKFAVWLACAWKQQAQVRTGAPRSFSHTVFGWFSNRTGTSVDDGARKSKNWLDQWQSDKVGTGSRVQSFSRAFPSSNDVRVLSLNQPITRLLRRLPFGVNTIWNLSFFFSGKQKPTKPPRTTTLSTTTKPPVRTGEDKNHPGKSCKVIKQENPQGGSGLYWINPDGGYAFQAYCDQETDGGGWTLVYSYRFTNYQ